MENCYGVQKNGTDVILEILVPPKSGTGAYIENIAGISAYNQMEVLLKRDAKMTVIDNPYFKTIDGVVKTIVPVVIQ